MHLFRKKVVEAIRFENIIIGEDISYIMDVLCNAEKIAYIAKALYHYRYVEGSTSHRWIKNTIECREIIWNHQLNFLKSFQEDMDKLAYAEVAYDNYIWAIYQLSSNLCTLSYRAKKIELLKFRDIINFEEYRNIYPLSLQHGLMKIKYMLVKYHLEKILLFLGNKKPYCFYLVKCNMVSKAENMSRLIFIIPMIALHVSDSMVHILHHPSRKPTGYVLRFGDFTFPLRQVSCL